MCEKKKRVFSNNAKRQRKKRSLDGIKKKNKQKENKNIRNILVIYFETKA